MSLLHFFAAARQGDTGRRTTRRPLAVDGLESRLFLSVAPATVASAAAVATPAPMKPPTDPSGDPKGDAVNAPDPAQTLNPLKGVAGDKIATKPTDAGSGDDKTPLKSPDAQLEKIAELDKIMKQEKIAAPSQGGKSSA